VELEDTCLVLKSDPITFAADEIGWYTVQVNANDIATTGATPKWFLLTALLPGENTTVSLVEKISNQVFQACSNLGISLIGGHTEITYGIDRPILAGTMIGEVPRENLITPKGACPGNRILLTKGVPIEGTAILAREFPERLIGMCSEDEIRVATDYLFTPGISVVRDAQIAIQAGSVTAMHDPTEGGLAGALWELAQACGHTLEIDPKAVLISPLSKKICQAFEIDPMMTIASGALLLTCSPESAQPICQSLQAEGIPCADIGTVLDGDPTVQRKKSGGTLPLRRPKRDEIARLLGS
jgi:hydrogenase maturation factor